jgi:type I restriction-modification system DNA methylase subunit
MNQDDLLQFLHSIHNRIRNANGLKLTGLSALNEINNFFALYFIKDKVVKKGLPDECSFDKIYKKYATDDIIKADKKVPSTKSNERMSYLLWKNVYDSSNEDCLMRQIVKNDYFSSYFANDVAKASAYSTNVKACDTIQEIINMIYKKFKNVEFNYKMYDALGSAYERFKTDEISNSGKHTGQHFTPVAVKKIIIDELKPTHEDTFYEPCSGSGGFIHTACHYVYEHDNDNLEKFKKKIYANEINPEIQKPLMINMLLHDVPVNHINVENECDSLSKENCKRYMDKMTKCGTNVPFGVKTTLEIFDDYWEPVTNGKNIMKESTAQFIVHIYNCLKKDGIAGIVVDRGILNNGTDGKSWQKKFRKWLLENSDLYKIVYLPTGIFDYTNFATAVIFFKKGSKTKKVDFYEAIFIDPKKKCDVKIGDKLLKTMTVKEIEKQNWSLKIETEEKEELKAGWVKLGDAFEFDKKSKHKAGDSDNDGIYPFYTSSKIIQKSNHCDYTELSLIMGTGGKANIHIDKNFSCSADNFILITKKNYNSYCIYYYLKLNIIILEKGFHGGGIKHLSKDYIGDIQIPSLSLAHQTEIVEFLDKQFEKYNIELLTDKLKDIKLFDLLIAKQYDMCADALHLIYRKIETDAFIKSMDRDKKAVFNMLLNGCKYETVKLNDIVEICKKTKSLKASDGLKNGKYHFYTCAENHMYINEYEFKDERIIANRGGKANVKIDSKFSISRDDLHILNVTSPTTTNLYVYSYLKHNIHLLENHMHGGGLKHINQDNLLSILVKLPSLEDQKKIISEIEKIEKEQSNYKQYGDMLQGLIDNIQNVIKKIASDKSSNKKGSKKSNDDTDSESEESSGSEDEKQPKKTNKKKNSKESSDDSESDSPKKINKKKSSKTSSDGESSDSSDDEKPKKINKNKKVAKKVIIVEESDSSESESDDEKQKCEKCKKKETVSNFKKGSKTCTTCKDEK